MENTEFEELISKYISELPPKYIEGMKNVDILVDYDNFSHKNDSERKPGEVTLGLYVGLPNTERPGHYRNVPDIITIYKKSLESISKNDSELAENLRKVLLHEIGHYYGMDEDKLKKLGY